MLICTTLKNVAVASGKFLVKQAPKIAIAAGGLLIGALATIALSKKDSATEEASAEEASAEEASAEEASAEEVQDDEATQALKRDAGFDVDAKSEAQA